MLQLAKVVVSFRFSAFGISHRLQFACTVKDFQLKLYVFRLANNNKND